jgi:hypothetical protein
VATFPFFCEEHQERETVDCLYSQLAGRIPKCPECGRLMIRDWMAQGPGSFSNPSKGRYGFVSENILPGGVPVQVDSAQTEAKLLKANGKERHSVSQESQYRHKHRMDRVREAK